MCCVPYHMQTERNCFLQKTFTSSSLCITYRSYGKLWSTINKINNQERNLICIDFQFLLSAYGVVRFIQFFIIIVSPDRAAALRFSFLCFLFCWDFCCKRAMQCHSSRDRRVLLLHILRIPISVQTALTCELKWAKAGRSALFCWKRKFNEKSNTWFCFVVQDFHCLYMIILQVHLYWIIALPVLHSVSRPSSLAALTILLGVLL